MLIHKAIRSLINQKTRAQTKYEIVIVDNCSTDDTKKKVEEITKTTGDLRIRYCYEPKLGLSSARNRGVTKAQGTIVAFLDDDAEAAPNWLQEILDSFQRYPEACGIGGKTAPLCDDPKPRWFAGRMLRYLGGHDLGDKDLLLDKKEHPAGGNMAFKRHLFSAIDGFREDLGRKGQRNSSHEEGELFYRICALGKPIYYVPKVRVFHWQPIERQRIMELINIRFNYGKSEAWVDWHGQHKDYVFAKTMKKVFMSVLTVPSLIPLALSRRTADVYYVYLTCWFNAGYTVGVLEQILRGGTLK